VFPVEVQSCEPKADEPLPVLASKVNEAGNALEAGSLSGLASPDQSPSDKHTER
jgi:hypothetical protein